MSDKKMIKITDKAIREAATTRSIIDKSLGVVADANSALTNEAVRQIKREVEASTGLTIIRKSRPDTVQAKHVRKVVLGCAQLALVVKAGE